jgi:hypothetical protein
VVTAIIPVGPASVYLSRLSGIVKLIAESAVGKLAVETLVSHRAKEVTMASRG